jgi:hypothetical protein
MGTLSIVEKSGLSGDVSLDEAKEFLHLQQSPKIA